MTQQTSRASRLLDRACVLLGLAVTGLWAYAAWYTWGTITTVIDIGLALAGLLATSMRSWPILCGLAGGFFGALLGSWLEDKPLTPLVLACLLALGGAWVGRDLARLERWLRRPKAPPE
jgi:hypothetical protein